jgi:hypothetical protein
MKRLLSESALTDFFDFSKGGKPVSKFFGGEEDTVNNFNRMKAGEGDFEYSSDPDDFMSARVLGVQFEQYFMNKAFRIRKYTEMANSAELGYAIDMICDDTIVPDSDGEVAHLDVDSELQSYVRDYYQDVWDYMYYELFDFDEIAWDLFKRFLIEGELFIKFIYEYDSDGEKSDVIDFRIIPAYTVLPIFKGDKIIKYAIGDVEEEVKNTNGVFSTLNHYDYFKKDTIDYVEVDDMIYLNYGEYGVTKADIRGYLEKCVRPYNQLRHLVDSLVTYRIVRAPQRRLWNIAVPRGGRKRGTQFLQSVIEKYKKVVNYDPQTGAMDSSKNHQSMQEDIWLAKTEGTDGSSVDTIDGDMNLGDLNDINIIIGNLQKAAKIPQSRWMESGSNQMSFGRSGDLLREEMHFSRFTNRLQNKFRLILTQTMLRIMELRGLSEEFLNEKYFSARFNKMNLFQELKEMEVAETRVQLLNSFTPLIISKENMNGMFHKDLVLKEYFKMSSEEFERNKELIEEFLAEVKAAAEEDGATPGAEAGMGDDMGDGFQVGGETFGGDLGGDMGGDFGGGVETAGEALPGAEDIIQL